MSIIVHEQQERGKRDRANDKSAKEGEEKGGPDWCSVCVQTKIPRNAIDSPGLGLSLGWRCRGALLTNKRKIKEKCPALALSSVRQSSGVLGT